MTSGASTRSGLGAVPSTAGEDLAGGRITDANKGVGPLAPVVPGSPAGWLAVLERYGSGMDASAVFAPAIELAEGGFPLTKLGEVFFNGGYLDEIDYGHTNARGTYCVDDDTPLPEPWSSSVSGGKPPGGMRAPPPSAVSDIDWPGAGGAGRRGVARFRRCAVFGRRCPLSRHRRRRCAAAEGRA